MFRCTFISIYVHSPQRLPPPTQQMEIASRQNSVKQYYGVKFTYLFQKVISRRTGKLVIGILIGIYLWLRWRTWCFGWRILLIEMAYFVWHTCCLWHLGWYICHMRWSTWCLIWCICNYKNNNDMRICVFILWINFAQSSLFQVFCGKKYAGLKKKYANAVTSGTD